MNFARVLGAVSEFLTEKGHAYALIGGVALAMYGLPRTTLDLDFLLDAGAQADFVGFAESLGYRTLHRSSGFSNHLHPDPSWGRIDGLYVRGATSREIFAACKPSRGPGGIEVPLPRPEHLAAMKVQAIKNEPGRTFQDLADVRFLLQLPGVDRGQVRTYFVQSGLTERFDELEQTL